MHNPAIVGIIVHELSSTIRTIRNTTAMGTEVISELRRLIAKHGSPEWKPLRMLPNITLTVVGQPSQPSPHVCEPSLTLVAQGTHRISLGDRMLDCQAGQYLVIPVDLPAELHVAKASPDRPYLSFGYALKPDKIATLLLEAEAGPTGDPVPSGIAISNATHDLTDAVVRLLRLLERPSDIPALATSTEREILWRLVNGQQGALIRQVGLASSSMTRIGIAIRRIRSRYAEMIRVEELANSVSMSVTSFHRHFRAITSMTPIQYQKRIRLQVARSRLMSTTENVATVGYAVGYDSPSQFSREYKRLFGLPPGKEGGSLRRLTLDE